MSLLRLDYKKTLTSISFALFCFLSSSWSPGSRESCLTCCEHCGEAHMAKNKCHQPRASEDVKTASEVGASSPRPPPRDLHCTLSHCHLSRHLVAGLEGTLHKRRWAQLLLDSWSTETVIMNVLLQTVNFGVWSICDTAIDKKYILYPTSPLSFTSAPWAHTTQ